MADECIHGLEPGLCDICSPRPVPEAARSTATASPRRPSRPTRSTGSTGSASRAPAVRPPGGPAAPRLDVARHRVVHVTHLDNLPGILAAGALLVGAHPVRDVSSEVTRELRRSAPYPRVPGSADEERSVADAVAFALTPDSVRWRELRAGASGPAWSDAARSARATDFVALVATVGALVELDGGTVLADGDAAAATTRFASAGDRSDAARLLGRLSARDDGLAEGELLVPSDVPLTSLVLVGVSNDPVRARVRDALDAAGAELRLAVHPPWFAV